MIHPHTTLAFIGPEIGAGVVATQLIPAGTIVWALDDLDQRISPQRAHQLWPDMGELLDKYSYFNKEGERILCWDLARFVNHSCRATCLSPGLDFEIAVRDILPGEQLTDDYATLNLTSSFECHCGEPTCRRVVSPGDYEAYAEDWDSALRAAFPRVREVEQPLWRWVRDKYEVERLLDTGNAPPSILGHHYKVADVPHPTFAHHANGAWR